MPAPRTARRRRRHGRPRRRPPPGAAFPPAAAVLLALSLARRAWRASRATLGGVDAAAAPRNLAQLESLVLGCLCESSDTGLVCGQGSEPWRRSSGRCPTHADTNGGMSTWDVSRVTDLTAVFRDAAGFNADISRWNVARVTSLRGTFYGASQFNQDLSSWNVGSVVRGGFVNTFTQAAGMHQTIACSDSWQNAVDQGELPASFTGADNLQFACHASSPAPAAPSPAAAAPSPAAAAPCSEAAPANAAAPTNLAALVSACLCEGSSPCTKAENGAGWTSSRATGYSCPTHAATHGSMSTWDVSRVTDLDSVFKWATYFNADLSCWDVSQATSMEDTFAYTAFFNGDLSKWNVERVTDLRGAFDGSAFNRDLSKWNVGKVTTLQGTFNNAVPFNADISKWNVARVTRMGGTFQSAVRFNQDLSAWNVSRVIFFTDCFSEAAAMNQTICSAAWQEKVAQGLINSFYAAPNLHFVCCLQGQRLSRVAGGGSNCVNCPVGQYQNASFHARPECLGCAPGTFAPATSRPCDLCPAGYAQRQANTPFCLPCFSGFFAESPGHVICQECEANTFSDGRWNVACQQCPAGFIARGSSAACVACAPGKFAAGIGDSCTNCAAGFARIGYVPGEVEDPTSCTACAHGSYQDEPGQSVCLPCIPGRANADEGQTECAKCPVDTFTRDPEMSACVPCPAGKSTSLQSGSASCGVCAPGTWQVRVDGGEHFCEDCPPGSFQPESNQRRCELCPRGFYQIANRSAACLPCIPGKANNLTGQLECEACAENTFAGGPEMIACQSCGHGQYAPGSGSATCFSCDAGKAGTPCTACVAGRYRGGADNAEACMLCPKGFSQPDNRSAACLPCIPGRANNLLGQTECQMCPEDTFTSSAKQPECISCPAGRSTASPGSASCGDCAPGTYIAPDGACEDCPRGYYQPESNQNTCLPCQQGFHQPTHRSAACLPCIPGRANHLEGQIFCQVCPGNTFTSEPEARTCTSCRGGRTAGNGSASCSACSAGKRLNAADDTCATCTAGRFSETQNAVDCIACPAGFAQPKNSSASCLPCNPGAYSSSEGAPECASCPDGWLQKRARQTACDEATPGEIVLGGGSAAVLVPPGQVIDPNVTSGFRQCDSGLIGTVDRKTCTSCPPGKSSLPGAEYCTNCAKGKYSDKAGIVCKSCPIGYVQPTDTEPSTTCMSCPAGWQDRQTSEGATACVNPGWTTLDDCMDSAVYLDDSHPDGSEWQCADCPAGASCAGAINASGVVPLFGWWRCPSSSSSSSSPSADSIALPSLVFTACKYARACLGAPNRALAGKYLDGETDLALVEFANESCTPGHQNPPGNNLRCSACEANFASPAGVGGVCTECAGQTTGATVLIVTAMIFAIFGFILLIALKMKSSGSAKKEHSTMKRTLLTHLQMVAIVMSLTVPWPSAVLAILSFVSSLTSVSNHARSIECAASGAGSDAGGALGTGTTTWTKQRILYGLLVAMSTTPFAVLLLTHVYWFVCVPRSKALACGRTLEHSKHPCRLKRNPFASTPATKLGETTEGTSEAAEATTTTAAAATTTTTTTSTTAKRPWSTRDGWIVTNVLLLYLLSPSIVKSALQTLQIETVCGVAHWALDDTVEFASAEHQSMMFLVAVPSVLFYGVLVVAGGLVCECHIGCLCSSLSLSLSLCYSFISHVPPPPRPTHTHKIVAGTMTGRPTAS